MGDSTKWVKSKNEEEDWTMVITMAKLRMAHASTHGARKPPGPMFQDMPLQYFKDDGLNRGDFKMTLNDP